ncbi:MAG: hypothetical protein QOJ74_1345, partial [Ilumatobacteraceae bacterium]|nr:hypothetical protein [Ilumatobacteraceae bacterium]
LIAHVSDSTTYVEPQPIGAAP